MRGRERRPYDDRRRRARRPSPHVVRPRRPARSRPDQRPPRHGRADRSRCRRRRTRPRAAPRLHAARRQPERPRAAARPGRRDRAGRRARPSRPTARPARTRTRATTAGSSATSTASRPTGPTSSRASNAPYVPDQDRALLRGDAERLRDRERRHRAVLLPRRQARLPRPRLLRRAADAGSAPRAARSPRATSSPTSTATTSRTSWASSGASRHRARARQGGSVRTELQADCLAGVWAEPCRGRDPRAVDPRADRGRPRRGGGRRRRPDPGGRERPGGPRALDARLIGAARAVVHHRLPGRRRRATATRSAARSRRGPG